MVDNVQARYTLFGVNRQPVLGGRELTKVTFMPCRSDPFFQMPDGVMNKDELISAFTTNPEVARFFQASSMEEEFVVTFTRVRPPSDERVPSTNPSLQAVHVSPGSHVSNVKQTITH